MNSAFTGKEAEMRKVMIASSLLLFMLRTGFAQENASAAEGYAFFAPGITSSGGEGTAHIGFGGELLFKGIGIGPEIGYLTPIRSFGDGIGTLSPNISYHFRSTQLSPFVTGGYTLFFRNGHANGFNYGGGVDYWLADKKALRFEVRDNVMAEYDHTHFWGFRVGLSFR